MRNKSHLLIFMLIVFAAIRCAAQDSLDYPELLSPLAMEALESSGRFSFQLSLDDDPDYKTRATFGIKGVAFGYANWGTVESDQQNVSLDISTHWFKIGVGRGSPHIAKGMILGNTMMRFGPGLNQNAGLSSGTFRIGTSSNYSPLMRISGNINQVGLTAFRFRETWGMCAEIRGSPLFGGAALYLAETPLLETWACYKNHNFKGSLNLSFAPDQVNHVSCDLLYRQGRLSLYGAAVKMHQNFIAVHPDSKWGSGLTAGSRGYAGGISLAASPWTLNTMAYSIIETEGDESRLVSELRYKKNPFEFCVSYSYKRISELDHAQDFPYEISRFTYSEYQCKFRMNVALSKQARIMYQLQAAPGVPKAYASILRLDYRCGKNALRFQATACNGQQAGIYFIRPVTPVSYGIRKAPNTETLYVDLLYSREFDQIIVFILLRQEGINLGCDVKLS